MELVGKAIKENETLKDSLSQLQSDEFEKSFDSALGEVGKEVDLSILPSIGGDLDKHLNDNLGVGTMWSGGAMGPDGTPPRP